MNRHFPFYPTTLNVGTGASAHGVSAEWRLVFKDQFEKFSHSLEVQMQQQLQNYSSTMEILLNQQSLFYQKKMDEMQQTFTQQLVHSHNVLLETLDKQQSHFQSQRDNLSNTTQKVKKLQIVLEKQSQSIANSHDELLKIVKDSENSTKQPHGGYGTMYFPNYGQGDEKFSPNGFIDYNGLFMPVLPDSNGFASSPATAIDANSAGFVQSPQPALSRQSSVSFVNPPTPVSVQSVVTDATPKNQTSSPAVNSNLGTPKKSAKKKASKAATVEPIKADKLPVSAAQASGKKTKSTTPPKPSTPQKVSQTEPVQSKKMVENSQPSPKKGIPQNGKAATPPMRELKNNAANQKSAIDLPTKIKSATIADVPVINKDATPKSALIAPGCTNAIPTPKKSKKKKKKAGQTQTSGEGKENMQSSAAALTPKDVMKSVLKGQKLHVNLLFLLSQLQLKSFQSVQDMMSYLEKEKDFQVHDCWVECC